MIVFENFLPQPQYQMTGLLVPAFVIKLFLNLELFVPVAQVLVLLTKETPYLSVLLRWPVISES